MAVLRLRFCLSGDPYARTLNMAKLSFIHSRIDSLNIGLGGFDYSEKYQDQYIEALVAADSEGLPYLLEELAENGLFGFLVELGPGEDQTCWSDLEQRGIVMVVTTHIDPKVEVVSEERLIKEPTT